MDDNDPYGLGAAEAQSTAQLQNDPYGLLQSQQPQQEANITLKKADKTNQQMTGIARDVGLPASNVLKGLDAVAGIPGQLAQSYDALIGAPFARMMSGQSPQFGAADPNFMKLAPPTIQDVQNSTKAAGLTDRPDLQPQTLAEKAVAAGAQGAGGALPLALMGDLPDAAKQLAAGAGSNIGSESLGSLANKLPDSMTTIKPTAQAAASLIGGLLGGGAATGAANTVQRGVNMAAGQASPVLQAYQDLGMTPNLVGDVSQNPSMQSLQAFASKWPVGAGKVRDAADNSVNEFNGALDNIAGQLGSSRTAQEAGTVLQDQSQKWLDNWKQAKTQAYDNLDQTMGNGSFPITNLKSTLAGIKNNAGGNDELENFLSSGLSKQVSGIADSSDGALSWNQIKALRTRIGEHLDNPSAIADSGGAQAKQLYGALSKDMESAANSVSPQASQAFNSANQLTSNGHDFVENVLSKVVGKDPEKAASNLLATARQGGSTLQPLRDNLPDAADELAAYQIRNAAAKGGPANWLSASNKMSPEAQSALFNPSVQNKLNSADTVANAMQGTEKLVNHSNSGHQLGMAALMAEATQIPVAAWEGHQVGGLPGAISAAGLGLAPFAIGPVGSRLAVNQPLARFMSTPISHPQNGYLPAYAFGSLGGSNQ